MGSNVRTNTYLDYLHFIRLEQHNRHRQSAQTVSTTHGVRTAPYTFNKSTLIDFPFDSALRARRWLRLRGYFNDQYPFLSLIAQNKFRNRNDLLYYPSNRLLQH